jgi:hypothetical protein
MIRAMARHRMRGLRADGKPLRRIATETGIPLRTVKRIVQEPLIEAPGGVASAQQQGAGRPSVVDRYRERSAAEAVRRLRREGACTRPGFRIR